VLQRTFVRHIWRTKVRCRSLYLLHNFLFEPIPVLRIMQDQGNHIGASAANQRQPLVLGHHRHAHFAGFVEL
jgi:hypothetical protein